MYLATYQYFCITKHLLNGLQYHFGFLKLKVIPLDLLFLKKTHARMKHRIDQQAGNKVMATLVYSRWPTVVILIFGIREFYQLIGHPQNPTPG